MQGASMPTPQWRFLRVSQPGLMPVCCHLPRLRCDNSGRNLRRFDNGAAQR
jgi:hypothetical protein